MSATTLGIIIGFALLVLIITICAPWESTDHLSIPPGEGGYWP